MVIIIKKYRKEFHEVLDRNRTFVDSLSKTLTEIEETRTNVLQEKTVIAQDNILSNHCFLTVLILLKMKLIEGQPNRK